MSERTYRVPLSEVAHLFDRSDAGASLELELLDSEETPEGCTPFDVAQDIAACERDASKQATRWRAVWEKSEEVA